MFGSAPGHMVKVVYLGCYFRMPTKETSEMQMENTVFTLISLDWFAICLWHPGLTKSSAEMCFSSFFDWTLVFHGFQTFWNVCPHNRIKLSGPETSSRRHWPLHSCTALSCSCELWLGGRWQHNVFISWFRATRSPINANLKSKQDRSASFQPKI